MGSLLAIIVTELGISADLWLGFGPSIALAGGLILGWVILLNRTAKPSRQTPATIVPIFVFTAGLLALLYLMTQPAYLWRPADSLPIEANGCLLCRSVDLFSQWRVSCGKYRWADHSDSEFGRW